MFPHDLSDLSISLMVRQSDFMRLPMGHNMSMQLYLWRLYLFTRATLVKYHNLGCLNNQNRLFFTVLEALSPRSRCQQVELLLKSYSLPVDDHLLAMFSQGLSSVHEDPRCLFLYIIIFSSCKYTNHIRLELTLTA